MNHWGIGIMEYVSAQLFCRLFCLSFALAVLGLKARAAEAFVDWAFSQETSSGLGYDSNIYGASQDVKGDGYALLGHSIQARRENSLATIQLDAAGQAVRYESERDADTFTGSVELDIAYPNDRQDASFWNGNAYWIKETRIDVEAETRLTPKRRGAFLAGEWLVSPKLGLSGRVFGEAVDYGSGAWSSTSQRGLTLGLGYALRSEQRWRLEYTYIDGESDFGEGTDAEHQVFGLRVRGRILPKVRGYVFLGGRNSDFSGLYDFSDSGPNVEADLVWEIAEDASFGVGVESEYNFSAIGTARRQTEVSARYGRELGGGFRGSVRLGYGLNAFESGQSQRDDTYWLGDLEIEYAFTERFFARLTASRIANESELQNKEWERNQFTAQAGLRY